MTEYPGNSPADTARLLDAISFAAHRHRFQKRKDREASPYINHPIDAAELLARGGGVTDMVTLLAAVLHDTVEDTQTTPEEIEARFGPDVRGVVEEVTDDKSLLKEERKRLQVEHTPTLSSRAKLVKLVDKISNVIDVTHHPPADWPLERRVAYLDWSAAVVAGCAGVNPALERYFADVQRDGRAELGRFGGSP